MRVYIINTDRVIVVPQYPAELSKGPRAPAMLSSPRRLTASRATRPTC
jgi:hypothetical protein